MTFRIAVVQPIANPIEEAQKYRRCGQPHRPRQSRRRRFCGAFRKPTPAHGACPQPSTRHQASQRPCIATALTLSTATIEPLSHNEGTAHNLICMAYGDGRPLVSYRRTHPNGPWIYTGGQWWEFQYVPGNEFPVF
jgi:hypothetical protein